MEYCTFLNPHMNGGLVLLSSEVNVDVIDAFPFERTLVYEAPPFYLQEMPGKGFGLIANRSILKGEVVMKNTPALLVQFGPHLELDGETRLDFYEKAVRRLPKERQDSFMRQYGEDVFVKIDRNSFRLFINGERKYSGHLGCFPDVSKFNHDCRPNLHYRIANITHTVIAARNITAGEELTVSYIDGTLSQADRQSRLDDWGFKCACAVCSAGAEGIAASDARLERIHEIEDGLEKMVAAGGAITPELGAELVALYEQEGLLTYLGHAYTRAALLFSMVADEEQAVRYARQAAEAMVREHGPGAGDAKAMMGLADRPREHWSWGVGTRAEKGEDTVAPTKAAGKVQSEKVETLRMDNIVFG
ncbi:hypothetical protein B0H67DRAFT_478747 [Lasiosphaeris hirsuta]|uniref:SET domain-containing protein n=1 Tax=Lasiosphaeris hirsuta TaxID=260670 RepID=A0AA40B9L3_9PEZI|nr:hypothetical protein B0H67DRAFT_478747 [Lasiosphaeris hirsuta]